MWTTGRGANRVLPGVALAATILCAFWYIAGPWIAPAEYGRFWKNEGAHEVLQFLVLLGTVAAAIRLTSLRAVRSDRRWFAWACLLLAGAVYAAGEEVSWGQHLFGWNTPEFWSRVNDQQETNLHNTSSVLDQLPRLLVTILTVLVSIVIPIWVSIRPELRDSFIGRALCSPLALVPTLFVLSARNLPAIFPTMTEYGYWPGEAKELYLYLFGLVYLLESASRAQELGDEAGTR